MSHVLGSKQNMLNPVSSLALDETAIQCSLEVVSIMSQSYWDEYKGCKISLVQRGPVSFIHTWASVESRLKFLHS